ncbi:adrenocorticotropic hormone receptor-like [Antedon mediterranea]|uniref:adrenocorticotropic hormone receptor-like n=1 Tax=Antedon mediterranea TaxID=105859 RepID=UPI003AF7F69D
MEYEDEFANDSTALNFTAPSPGTEESKIPWIIYHIVGVFAAIENAIVLLIVLKSKKFRNKRNIFLFSLSLADFIVGLQSVLIYADIFNESYVFGSILDAMFLVSMFSISAVCIERYIAIVGAPFTYKQIITLKRCLVVCFFIWDIPITVILVIYGYVYNRWTRFAFACVSLCSIVANCILYYKISLELTKNDRKITEDFRNNMLGRSRKLIRSFTILLVISSVCWLPLCCFWTLAVIYETVDNNVNSENWLFCLALSNSVINPIVYWFRLPGIKEELQNLICCCRNVAKKEKANSNSPQTISTVTTSLPISVTNSESI